MGVSKNQQGGWVVFAKPPPRMLTVHPLRGGSLSKLGTSTGSGTCHPCHDLLYQVMRNVNGTRRQCCRPSHGQSTARREYSRYPPLFFFFLPCVHLTASIVFFFWWTIAGRKSRAKNTSCQHATTRIRGHVPIRGRHTCMCRVKVLCPYTYVKGTRRATFSNTVARSQPDNNRTRCNKSSAP